jgi:hypothetical protein
MFRPHEQGLVMDSPATRRQSFSDRLQQIRIELYGQGEDGIAGIAEALILPPGTWRNYEAAVTMPAEILLMMIDLTNAAPRWLLTGNGERYSRPDYFGGQPRFDC